MTSLLLSLKIKYKLQTFQDIVVRMLWTDTMETKAILATYPLQDDWNLGYGLMVV